MSDPGASGRSRSSLFRTLRTPLAILRWSFTLKLYLRTRLCSFEMVASTESSEDDATEAGMASASKTLSPKDAASSEPGVQMDVQQWFSTPAGLGVLGLATLIVLHRAAVLLCERCARHQRRALRDEYEPVPGHETGRWACRAASVATPPRLSIHVATSAYADRKC